MNLPAFLEKYILRYIPMRGEESEMETAKLFSNGGSQAVRLPKDCRFEGEEEVFAKKYGDIVYLFPKDKAWVLFMDSLELFTNDFMVDGRKQPAQQRRAEL